MKARVTCERFVGTVIGILAVVTLCTNAAWAQPNPIVTENALPGSPSSEWDIDGAGDDSIQGFATDISVNKGGTISFKIDTDSTNYRLDIYRMGYYGGLGARHVATVQPSAALPQNQPACVTDSSTGLIDCGNWAVSASWNVPSGATSGIYFAKLVREDPENGRASHIAFVVRDDSGGSDILFQTSDTTWQAYNQYGGNSLYVGSPAGRAYKVSYNRPFTTRGTSPEDWVFNAEYPMVRWLESNGYDVSYSTGLDADRRGAEILEHHIYMAVGHDEYWSNGQRTNVQNARDAGVDLAFFSGNEVFWKTRWESSIAGPATTYRTLVTYKETHANAVIDPQDPPTWTGTWRDPRFSPPADGNRPENGLTGTIFTVNCCSYSITVPSADGRMRFWRNTDIATLPPAQTGTLPGDTLGYEWDEDLDNGSRPPGLVRLSSTTITVPQRILDFGSNYGPGTATHHAVFHKRSNGALVFGAGTVQWSWGLDSNHDRGANDPDVRMQQATVNLFADMGVQPDTLQPGLVSATASTDTIAPTAVVTSPLGGSTVSGGAPFTITGTAADTGGGVVGGVEVSVDGGATWHPATGREQWTYRWNVPGVPGAASIRARAVDDSGNLGAPSSLVVVAIAAQTPDTGPGGPILVISSPSNPFTRYYAEILRNEGLNEFSVADIGTVTASTLTNYDVVILGEMSLTGAQVTMLTNWVTAGGNLIAMRPDAQLAGLLGLSTTPNTLVDAYLLINTASGPGVGLVNQTIQFHATANRYTLNGATALATLYSTASAATTNPAVSLRSVGSNGGQAAAFTYDLARSVVYTRQGNPAFAGQERDGHPPIRPDDQFFSTYVDLNKVAIPQADEQQRLLANMILSMNLDHKPLPRFWYLPHGFRAAVVMTGDEHSCCGPTRDRFDIYIEQSPPGCSVDDWECVRATSYIYPGGDGDDSTEDPYDAQGFEWGVHILTNCADWTPTSLNQFFNEQLDSFAAQFPGLPAPTTNRTHCIVWSDWSTQPDIEFSYGVRLDTNYYYWPPEWITDRPGMFTGSGMPMRFARLDGSMIDVYQAVSQMTDESGQSYPFTIDTLLDNATGTLGYYGVFTANMHTDFSPHPGSDAIVASAQAHGVPVVAARQMLKWLDGRNGSAFGSPTWTINKLTFTVSPGAGSNGLQGLLPVNSAVGPLNALKRNGSAIAYTTQTIKGVSYATFSATAGSYEADYTVIGDDDGDGYAEPQDCDDTDPNIHPGAAEICNGKDDDCNGQTDELFTDLGNSCTVGVGACLRMGVRVCTPPGCSGEGCATGSTECSVTPGTPGTEVCNGIDDNCDGQTDEPFTDLGDSCTVGVGDCARTGVRVCTGDHSGTQCNATPGAAGMEVCDGHDNDCDGSTDEGTSGLSCTTGQPGVCSPGHTLCSSGVLSCVPNTAPSVETCNGLDDDCDGATDETFTDLGTACSVGVGDCSRSGVRVCTADHSGTQCNVTAGAPGTEVCDGHDNDCDGQTDDGDPGGGGACTTGQLGVCSPGVRHCQGGALVCVANAAPTGETCNGLDDDCDGLTDETFTDLGTACTVGVGECARTGVRVCTADHTGTQCSVTAGTPGTEVCNGRDDNCNGQTDENDPGGGGACTTGQQGACSVGTNHCQGGAIACVPNASPTAETCNNVDDDCDGQTDEGNPGGGGTCTTGQPGICSSGHKQCQAGVLQCIADAGVPEVCDGLDNNCDGHTDEGNPGGGASCSTGQQGICSAGTQQCQGGSLHCVAINTPGAEICGNALDDNCNGQTDESGCVLCLAANTVTLDTQTKRTVVRQLQTPAHDKVLTKGTFVMPSAGMIAPPNEAVTLQLTDATGINYQVTLPPGTFTASGSGKRFRYSDGAATVGGVRLAKFIIKGDGRTVKYIFKAQNLDQPVFTPGTGTATVQIGTHCFVDSADVCSVSGSSARCQ